jgi:hypothetical protein
MSGDWADDYDDDAPIPPQDGNDVAAGDVDAIAAAAKRRAFGIDIGQVAEQYVAQAVDAQIKKQIAEVAAESVASVFTEEVLEDLRDRSARAAEEALRAQIEADEADTTTQPAPDGTGTDDEAEAEPQLLFGSVDEWVRVWLRVTYRRRIDGDKVKWEPDWWRFPEAVNRLDVLWRAWEQMRREPGASMSAWWRDHADHHMAVLMSATGPFAARGTGYAKATASEPLPYQAPPEGLFTPEPHTYREGAAVPTTAEPGTPAPPAAGAAPAAAHTTSTATPPTAHRGL